MLKPVFKAYFARTPIFWKKTGDSILLLGTTLSATFAGMEVAKEWIILSVILSWLGKTVTNFFTE